MTASNTRRADRDIRRSVEDELAWTPDVDDAGIGVAVVDGTVTLSGQVDDLGHRQAARRAAFRTDGVTTLVDDLVIHPSSYAWTSTETDIAKKVKSALEWSSEVPVSVRATVEGHTVTLTGTVRWHYERAAARRAVAGLTGVSSVVNEIVLSRRAADADTEKHIRAALVRNATIDADRVHVTTSGTTVTLTGQVRSYDERQQAESTAWASPHVDRVLNDIVVGR